MLEIYLHGFWKGVTIGVLIGFFVGVFCGFGLGSASLKWSHIWKTNDELLWIHKQIYNQLPKPDELPRDSIQ
jgi:hypothetical protein